MLGDEAAAVLGNKRGELIKHPAVDDLWKRKSRVDSPGRCDTILVLQTPSAKMGLIGNRFSLHDLDLVSAV